MHLVVFITLFLNHKLNRGGAEMNIVPGKDCAVSYFSNTFLKVYYRPLLGMVMLFPLCFWEELDLIRLVLVL